MHSTAGFDSKYTLRRKFFTFLGAKFHVYDSQGSLAFYSKMKAFKLKEDMRLYSDESMTVEILSIRAKSMIDFGATYEVTDSRTGHLLGAFRRKGLKSILKDEWLVLDASGGQIGTIKEDSLALALVRRFLLNIIPQSFTVEVGEQAVCIYKQHFNPFVQKIAIDFSNDPGAKYDRLLGIAGAILLCVIESRQN